MSFPFYAIFPTQISKKYSIVLCYMVVDMAVDKVAVKVADMVAEMGGQKKK